MTFLSRLFGTGPDPKEAFRPLWHAIVAEARNPEWYRTCGAADTVEGRFDMIASVTALVMLRLDSDDSMIPASARLTELFAEDMEGQLRETGLGDPTLGKKMAKLMESLGGRIGAFRNALPAGVGETAQVVERNARLRDGQSPDAMAERLIAYSQHLAQLSDEQVQAGEIAQ